MTENKKHEPSPWHISAFGYIATSEQALGQHVHVSLATPFSPPFNGVGREADDADHVASANAAHIVKCVNAHDDLVSLAKDLAAVIDVEQEIHDPDALLLKLAMRASALLKKTGP